MWHETQKAEPPRCLSVVYQLFYVSGKPTALSGNDQRSHAAEPLGKRSERSDRRREVLARFQGSDRERVTTRLQAPSRKTRATRGLLARHECGIHAEMNGGNAFWLDAEVRNGLAPHCLGVGDDVRSPSQCVRQVPFQVLEALLRLCFRVAYER